MLNQSKNIENFTGIVEVEISYQENEIFTDLSNNTNNKQNLKIKNQRINSPICFLIKILEFFQETKNFSE
jgi:hypothetical protein